MKYYYYISPSLNAWENLALDEFFLNELKGDYVLLYLYINHDAVIIGRNQNAWKECNLEQMDRDEVKLVRRMSGGGAVFHDIENLNFSFHANRKNYNLDRQVKTVLDAVRNMGISAEYTGRNDISVDGKKFSGNAFCIRGDNELHHGTLLINTDMNRLSNYLNVSAEKIRSKGVESVKSRVCNLTDYNPELTVETAIEALKESFRSNYGDFEEVTFSEDSKEKIDKLFEKHKSWEWRLGETIQFDYVTEKRFPWGEIDLNINIKQGIVDKVELFTDALDTSLPEIIKEGLIGSRFNSKEMAESLLKKNDSQQIKDVADYIISLNI
jgi:lipoate-protein ligase A